MASFEIEQDSRPPARIKVIGVGGGGANAVDGMMANGLENVEFFAINTDSQALGRTTCPNRLQIGTDVTRGLGCGGDPLLGEKAANASKEQIGEILKGADMIFLTAGLGGGTGTGATPVIAQMAKETGVLTVAFVTRPFSFEGPQRMQKAKQGIEKLRDYVDTLIIVSNDRLLEVVGNKATLLEAFSVANTVLAQGVKSISDLIAVPGLINLDFADVRAIMGERGGAVMGVGIGKGENRAEEAVKKACSSPLLDKIEIDGATGVLICVTGPADLRLSEINTATSLVYEAADPQANIIFGAVIEDDLDDEMRVTIIATGFSEDVKRPAQETEDEERLTSPTSSVSLRAKLESMLSEQPEAPPADEKPATPPPPDNPAPTTEPPKAVHVPPPPKFPESDTRREGRKTPPPRHQSAVGVDVQAKSASTATGVETAPVEPPPVKPRFPQSGPRQQGEIDFQRIPSGDARQEVTGKALTPTDADETGEEDLETPAYLRRRRELFD
jgi:cell division protein FtsZ